MKREYSRISILSAAAICQLLAHEGHARKMPDTFYGPGIVECEMGTCDFSVQSGNGCSDPCHTRHHHHMYDWAFEDLADVSDGFQIGRFNNDNAVGEGNWRLFGGQYSTRRPCFHKHAETIDSHFPDKYVEIEKGCIAQCTGCTFASTTKVSGPGLLSCRYGRCAHYTTGNFDCGDDIEAASTSSGSFQTLLSGDDTVYSLYGYEGIAANTPIAIPAGCTLHCSGCGFQVTKDRQGNLRNNRSNG